LKLRKTGLGNDTLIANILVFALRFAAHGELIRSRVEFLMEAVLMADFDHRNVMWLIAIVIDSDMVPHVVLPLMQHGDLRSFVHEPTNVSISVKCLAVRFSRYSACLYET